MTTESQTNSNTDKNMKFKILNSTKEKPGTQKSSSELEL